MPAKDIFHDTVGKALSKDGWRITNDPLTLTWKETSYFVDFAAEKLLTAEKGDSHIAVEVKSFIGASDIHDLHNAIGQYQVYRSIIRRTRSEMELYLAISSNVYEARFQDDIGSLLIEDYAIKILVFDERKEEITKWIH